ncbi:hypothetical protein IL306_003972 [Fusarium sp. DS 682]|nr:hypothetical protein IL306_003972 [Fusarium sp. DS 682]
MKESASLPPEIPIVSTSNLAAKPEPNMSGFPFLRLPVEIQMKIIQMLIPPMVLPEHITTNGIVVRNVRAATRNLMLVCKQMKGVVLSNRKLIGKDVRTGQVFSFDPTVDTLLVKKGIYPDFFFKAINHKEKHLSIRRVMSFSQYPMLPSRLDPTGNISEEVDETDWNLPTSDATEMWRNLPFKTVIPFLRGLEHMEEMIVVIQNCPRDWHIDSFQQYGPDPERPRKRWRRIHEVDWDEVKFPLDPDNNPLFEKLNNPVHDTGIEWKLPRSGDHISAWNDRFWSYHRTPMIGPHGYSKTSKDQPNKDYALGGKWAGFRYSPDNHEVEFRPLMFDEVEHIVHRQYQPEQGRKIPDNQDPQFIARV